LPNIETLEKDIAELLTKGTSLHTDVLAKYGGAVAMKLERQLTRHLSPPRTPKTLRASEVGMMDVCPRKLWYSYHHSEIAPPLDGVAVFKFLYGDIVEESVLTLAKAAGHNVEKEQHEVDIKLPNGWRIVGHLDAVIDGVLVDVKSTTTYGMRDFVAGRGGDKFGYRAQLNVYSSALGVKRKGWVVVDKTIGNMKWIEEDKPYDTYQLLEDSVATLELPTVPKNRLAGTVEPNGNVALARECSYCPYKKECWADANFGRGLRTFAYSTGPTSYIEIKKLPRVPEIMTK
jgi:hypothetical protein